MLIRLTSLLFAALAAILLATPESSAQGRGGGGGGAGGTSSFGSGQQGFGQSSSGFGSSGSSSLGQSAFGQSTFGSGGTSGLGAAGATGVTGGTAAGATPFVGRGAADLNAFFGGINQAATNASQSQRSGSSGSSGSSETGRRPPVRVRLTVSPELRSAVSTRRAASPIRADRSIGNATRLIAERGLTGVRLAADGGTVTLSGVVGTPSERLLAEKLLAIEPGVRQIDNQLQVANEIPEVVPAPR